MTEGIHYNIEGLRGVLWAARKYKMEKNIWRLKWAPLDERKELMRMYNIAYTILYHKIRWVVKGINEIAPHDRDDVTHNMYFYLVGDTRGYFNDMAFLLVSDKYTFKQKAKIIEDQLKRCAKNVYKAIVKKAAIDSHPVMDGNPPEWIYAHTMTEMDPEKIVLVKEYRRAFIESMLTVDDKNRYPDKYEHFASEYLRYFYGAHKIKFPKVRLDARDLEPELRWAFTYAVYTIRRMLCKTGISVEDLFYGDEIQREVYPTFHEMLMERLGIDEKALYPTN